MGKVLLMVFLIDTHFGGYGFGSGSSAGAFTVTLNDANQCQVVGGSMVARHMSISERHRVGSYYHCVEVLGFLE